MEIGSNPVVADLAKHFTTQFISGAGFCKSEQSTVNHHSKPRRYETAIV